MFYHLVFGGSAIRHLVNIIDYKYLTQLLDFDKLNVFKCELASFAHFSSSIIYHVIQFFCIIFFD